MTIRISLFLLAFSTIFIHGAGAGEAGVAEAVPVARENLAVVFGDDPYSVLQRLRLAQQRHWLDTAPDRRLAVSIKELAAALPVHLVAEQWRKTPPQGTDDQAAEAPKADFSRAGQASEALRAEASREKVVRAFDPLAPLKGYVYLMPSAEELGKYPALSGAPVEDAKDADWTQRVSFRDLEWAKQVSFIATPAVYGETGVYSYCIGYAGRVAQKDMGKTCANYADFAEEKPFDPLGDWMGLEDGRARRALAPPPRTRPEPTP